MTPEPGSWQHDLVELLETLSRHEVPFLIVGGYAVGLDALIRNKRAVGRHQDLADVEELVRIRRERRS